MIDLLKFRYPSIENSNIEPWKFGAPFCEILYRVVRKHAQLPYFDLAAKVRLSYRFYRIFASFH